MVGGGASQHLDQDSKRNQPRAPKNQPGPKPMASMYCMVYSPTLIIHKSMPNVGKYHIHGSYGKQTKKKRVLRFTSPMSTDALDHGSEGFFEDLRQATRLIYRSESLGSWLTILTYAEKAGRARYALTSSTWSYDPYKWPKIKGFSWGYIPLLIGVVKLSYHSIEITCKASAPCRAFIILFL